jgi:hypothetical protein
MNQLTPRVAEAATLGWRPEPLRGSSGHVEVTDSIFEVATFIGERWFAFMASDPKIWIAFFLPRLLELSLPLCVITPQAISNRICPENLSNIWRSFSCLRRLYAARL